MNAFIQRTLPGLHLSSAIVIGATALVCAAPALADPITGQVGIASEYNGKGLGKNDEKPTAFGSVRWMTSGFYVNAFETESTSTKGAVADDLHWHHTDEHDLGSRYEGRLVASLSYSF